MKTLKDATEQEILEELEQRKRTNNVPKPLDKPDFSELIDMVTKETVYLTKNGYPSKDFEHYVHSATMEAIYGKEYWKWRNNLDY